MNYAAPPLRPPVLEAMKNDQAVIARIIKSYKMMLDFYGMQLLSEETGLVARAESQEKRRKQYRNLEGEYNGLTSATRS